MSRSSDKLYDPEDPAFRRRRARKRGPLFSAIWFGLVGLQWVVLMFLALHYLRPHPLTTPDYLMGGVGIVFGLFYIWVGYSVYRRRKYILNVAFACAGLGLLAFPSGTIFSALLLSDLMSRKHDFTR